MDYFDDYPVWYRRHLKWSFLQEDTPSAFKTTLKDLLETLEFRSSGDLVDPEQFTEKVALRDGISLSDMCFDGMYLFRASFDGMSLSSLAMRDCNLVECSFKGTQFSSLNMDTVEVARCRFDKAVIVDAIWVDVDIRNTKFDQMRLERSTFRNCSIKGCEFTLCDITKTSFWKTVFEGTLFRGSELDTCYFLGTDIHATSWVQMMR